MAVIYNQLTRLTLVFICANFGMSSDLTSAQMVVPSGSVVEEIITAEIPGRAISGLVTYQPGAGLFTHAIALFPGHPGILRLRTDKNGVAFDLSGNFLVRSRRQWLDNHVLTLVIDAPTDKWKVFERTFRSNTRYGNDVKALIMEVEKRFGSLDWTFVGTSEGSLGAFYAARMNSTLAKRVILTASLIEGNELGPGLRGTDWQSSTVPLLWVHHIDDPCWATSYRAVQEMAKDSKAPLLTVHGANGVRGDPCQARTQHGFVGIEEKTIKAMLTWIRTGALPLDVRD